MIRSDASTQPRAPALAKRGSFPSHGDQKHQDKERRASDEVAYSECGFVPFVRRVLDIEPQPNRAEPPPETTTTCCTASTAAAAATAVHNSENGSSNEQSHPVSPEKGDRCSGAGAGCGGSEHAMIACSFFQQSSYAADCGSPQESEATAPEATGGGKASTADATTLTATTDRAESKNNILKLVADGEGTNPQTVATATYRDFPVTATVTQTQTARSLEQQDFAPQVEQQGFAPHIEQPCYAPYVEPQDFAPHGWSLAAAACRDCTGFQDEENASFLAAAPSCVEVLNSLGQLSPMAATGASFAPPPSPVGACSKPPETPPQTPAWPRLALPRTAPRPGAAGRSAALAMTSAARLADGTEVVTTGANATGTPSAASTVCFFPRPPTPCADGGSSMPTPSAPWLVQEALSVKAAIDAAVRGAYCSSPGDIEVTSEGDRIDIGEDRLGMESDWNEKVSGSAATTVTALTDEVVGEVPRVMADLRAALGRGMSTSEAKAWVQALDRLGEGLDGEEPRDSCLDATRNLPPSPGHSDASFSPSTSAAPTVQEEPPRVFLSDPGPVSATASARRSRFLSSSWHISETVVDQSSSPADGAEKLVAAGVAAAGGGSASPAAAFDPLGMSLGDNDKAVCDESDFGHTSGGGHDGDEGERKQNSVREHAASSAACSSAQHSADTYGGTERRKTAAASGPEASEKEKPSSPSASLTRSSETADGCGDVTVSEEKPLSPSASLTRSSETADGCGDVTVSEENEEKEMRVAVAVSAAVKVDCDARSGGAGGGGAGGTRRRERRNATKFSDDVIGKVPCLCADLNAALGRNVGLQEVKNCLRLLDNSGEGLHRQALLEGCLALLRRTAERKAQLMSSAGEMASTSPLRVPILTIGKAVEQRNGSTSRRRERMRVGIERSSENRESPRGEGSRGSQHHPRPIIVAGGRRRRTASSRSPSDGSGEAERVGAISAGATITAPAAGGSAAAAGEEEGSTAPAFPKKRGRSPPSPEPFERQAAGGPRKNARGDGCGGGSSCRNRVGGGAGGEAVRATALGTKTNVPAPANRNAPKANTNIRGTAAALCARDGQHCPSVPRRSRGLIPDSVIAKVPRLLVDMESVLGYRVSLDEVKARCRELDHCGEGLTPEELCDACVCVLLRRASCCARIRTTSRGGVGGISSVSKMRRRKNVKNYGKDQRDEKDGKKQYQQQQQQGQEVGGGVRGTRPTKKSSISKNKKNKEVVVVAVATAGARPQSATTLPAGDGSNTNSAASHPSVEAASAESVSLESVSLESMSLESMSLGSVSLESMSLESMSLESVSAGSVSAESVSAESVSAESVPAELDSEESVSAEAEPEESVSAESVPAKLASEESMSAEAVSAESVPAELDSEESVSAEAEPEESVSAESVPAKMASEESVSAEAVSAESVPAELDSEESVSAEAEPEESMSAESVPAKLASEESMSAEAVSAESVPAELDSEESVSAEAEPEESVSAESVPAKLASEESMSAEAVSAESVPAELDSEESVSAEAEPEESVSAESVPAKLASEESMSPEAVSAESVPAELDFEESVSAEAEPEESVSAESVPAKLASEESMSAEAVSAESVPAELDSEESVSAEAEPEESMSAESVPAKLASEESVSAETEPEELVSAESVPAELVSVESVPAEMASEESVSAKTEPEESVSAESVSAEETSKVASSAEKGSEEVSRVGEPGDLLEARASRRNEGGGEEEESGRGELGDFLEARATRRDEGAMGEEERGRGKRDVETETETVGVPVKKKPRLETKNLPESVLLKVPRLVKDLETFVGQPVSVSEATERCQQLDHGGEGLTQQELCDACVSLILRSDDHIIDGGVANNGLAYDDPDRSEQPRPLKGGRVLGNVQDRGDFACLAEGACDFLGLGGWGGGARNWGAGKTALMLCPAQNVRDPNGNVAPARQQPGPCDASQGWSRPVGANSEPSSISGDQEYGVHDTNRSMPLRGLEVEGACHDEMSTCSSQWIGRCGIGLEGDEAGGSDSDAPSLWRSNTESIDENEKEQAIVSRAAGAAVVNRTSCSSKRVADGDTDNGSRASGADSTDAAVASHRRRIGTSSTGEVKPSREPLQCEVGEFAVFPTPSGSTVPFRVGKILEKRLVAQHHLNLSLPSPSMGGGEMTEILVHWFMPKKKTSTRATKTPAARAGGRSDGDISCGVGGNGRGGATAAEAASSYAIGGWSPVHMMCPTSKRLVRDTGLEDVAAAMVVFPRLLSSDALPAGVRDAVIVGVPKK